MLLFIAEKQKRKEIIAGKIIKSGSKLRCIVSKLKKYSGENKNPYKEYQRYTEKEYVDLLLEMKDLKSILSKIFYDYSNCLNMLDNEQNAILDAKIAAYEKIKEDEGEQRRILHEIISLFKSNYKSECAKPNEIIDEILHYINDNLSLKLSIRDIADSFHISVFYMCHLFKKYTNTAIVEYILNRRICASKELLRDSNISITDICFRLGFGSSSYFSKCFKRNVGFTPNEYRAKHNKKTNNFIIKGEK